MASWKKHLPSYEFMLWNFDRFDKNRSLWVKQAFEAKKYAFAADYIRLYALYNYGGIYLDTDVEVLKPYDDLLDLPYFLGKENSENIIEAATIGAEKGCFWVGECLKYYDGRKFEYAFGKYDAKPLPAIIRDIITAKHSLIQIEEKAEICRNDKNVYILPVDYFSPKKWDDPTIIDITDNTYSIHHFAGTWKNENHKEKIRERFSKISSYLNFRKLYRISCKIVGINRK
jgi:mannosyltransferase OCH1-like enzyme